MYFVVFPFFLGANVTVDNADGWLGGPEYSFSANLSLAIIDEPMGYRYENKTYDLRCRPHRPLGLACSLRKTGVIGSWVDFREHELLDQPEPFEIRFDRDGVESITIDRSSDQAKLDVIRRIVGQLTLGADLKENLTSVVPFATAENFAMGRCETRFLVAPYSNKYAYRRPMPWEQTTMELSVIAFQEQNAIKNIVVERVRNPTRCNGTDLYFSYMGYHPTRMIIRSSMSKMKIADTFESYTKTEADLVGTCTVVEIVSVSLQGIEEATGEMLPIFDPIVVGPFVERCVGDKCLTELM